MHTALKKFAIFILEWHFVFTDLTYSRYFDLFILEVKIFMSFPVLDWVIPKKVDKLKVELSNPRVSKECYVVPLPPVRDVMHTHSGITAKKNRRDITTNGSHKSRH